jgi:hypothetical protein
MTGADAAHAHDSHADHPISATLVLLALVAVFSAIFAAMTTKTFDTPVMIVATLLTVWGLVQIWVLDQD